MLRFSDDDVPLQDAQVSKKMEGANTSKPAAAKKESSEGGEVGPNKPNFVYIVHIAELLTFSLYINFIVIFPDLIFFHTFP